MRLNEVGSEWAQIKERIRNRWGRLADDELNWIEGREYRLAGLIQVHYGIDIEEAEQEIEAFCRECSCLHEEEADEAVLVTSSGWTMHQYLP